MDIVECLNTMCEAFLEIESEEIKYVQIQESSEGGYDYTLFEDSVEHYELIRILTDEEGEALLEAEYERTFV